MNAPSGTGPRLRDERGSGTLLVAGISLAMVTTALAATIVAAWFSTAHATQSAADLVALAGAGALTEGGDACRAAGEAALRNGTSIVECEAFGSGSHVVVEVSVEQPLRPRVPGFPESVVRTATAGSP